jgi:hypothetical protein
MRISRRPVATSERRRHGAVRRAVHISLDPLRLPR